MENDKKIIPETTSFEKQMLPIQAFPAHYIHNNSTVNHMFGLKMQQNMLGLLHLSYAIQRERPRRIIELGTANGGLSCLIGTYTCQEGIEFDTYDPLDYIINFHKDLFKTLNINYHQENCFEENIFKSICNKIADKGKSFILCDGGNKIKEFEEFHKYMKYGDIICMHDYSPTEEYFNRNIKGRFWFACEITNENFETSASKIGIFPKYFDIASASGWIILQQVT